MAEDSKSKGSSTTHNNDGNAVVKKGVVRWYYRPETEELIYIDNAQEATAVATEANKFAALVDAIQRTNKKIEAAVIAYEKTCNGYCANPIDKGNNAAKVDQQREQLIKDTVALKKALDNAGVSSAPKSGKALIELIPLDPNKQRGKDATLRKFIYVAKSKTGARAHWRSYQLNDGKNERGGGGSFLRKGSNGKSQLDAELLKKQLSEAKTKFKLGVKTDNFVYDLGAWAEAWNKNAASTKSIGSVDLGGQAQFMRFAAGAGSSVEFDPKKSTLLAKADAQASFSIAQAAGFMTVHYPDRLGSRWAWRIIDMGRTRVVLSVGVSGFIGASIAVEAGIEVQPSTKNKTQSIVKGAMPKPNTVSSFKGQRQLDQYTDKAGIDTSADVFAGASVTANFSGAVEWQEPDISKNKIAFKALAKVTPSLSGLAGIGGAAAFHMGYEDGKLRGYIKAGLCCGLGAKGSLAIEVDVKTIWSFCYWAYYNYLRIGEAIFEKLISPQVWEFISDLQVMIMSGIDQVGSVLQLRKEQFDLKFKNLVSGYAQVSSQAKQRNALAVNLMKRPNELLFATPKAKGYYLYELTRHGAFTGTHYDTRERAILAVLYSIQTKDEWTKVFNRMHPYGGIGGATVNREALQGFLHKINAAAKAREVGGMYAALPLNMGLKPVWRDRPQEIALAKEQWFSYQAHEGMLAGVSHFDLSEPFDVNHGTYTV